MVGEKILVVEDDPDVLDLCKQILASQGYQVKGAGDGYEAIERAKGEPFDLVLADIKMPGINGLQAYQSIKELNPDIIGVIITGYASVETAIEAVKLGFDGFVTKPFIPDELNAAVAKALERARLERENARLRALIPLFELSEAFMTTIDLDELLDQVVHTAQRETRADRVSLMLLDEASGELTIEAAVGLHLGVMAEAKAGEGIAGWVAKRGEALLLDDKAPLDPKIREAMKSDEVSSALCVPLKVKEDRVIGVLNLSKLGGTPFAGTDLELVSILCGQAAIAIENARLFEETGRLKAFNESIVQGVAEAILIEDAQGIFTFANPAAEELLGYTCEELIGQHWTTIVPEEQVAKVHQETAKRSQGIASHYETALLSKEGQVIPVIVSARPLFEDGKFVGILAAFTDITERKQAEEDLRQSYVKLQRTLEGTINTLVSAIEMRDPYTAGHQLRVAQLACAIAKEMGLPEEQIEGLRMAGLVHDIGKINVPAEILSKPGRLNDLEFGLIKTHAQVGHNILNGTIEFPWPVAQIVLQHHERMDGSGYPQGLSGDDIILEARILAVADVVEAMASHRPYRPPRGIDKALEEISQNRGILYDPEVVDVCLKLFTEKGFTFEQEVKAEGDSK